MTAITDILDRTFGAPRREIGTVRRVAFAPELRAINEQARTITFISSTESVDRYGDVLRCSGWKLDAYKRNPIFLWAHKSSEPPIGRTLDIHTETQPKPALVQTVQFADKATYGFADSIFNLYKGKFLTSVSVGFLPLEQPKRIVGEGGEWTGGYEFTSMELLETSAVPVPANTECVARALQAGAVTERDVERCFVRTDGQAREVLDALDRLEETLTRMERKILASDERYCKAVRDLGVELDRVERLAVGAGKISTAAEFERALRGGGN